MTEFIVQIINRETGALENTSDPFDNFQDAARWAEDTADSDTKATIKPWRAEG